MNLSHKNSGDNLQNLVRSVGGQLGNDNQGSTSALNDSTTQANQKRLKHLSEQQNKIDDKDKKLKEMQMLRLQGKLRDFIRIEKELRAKIKSVEDRDKNLVSKLEEAICFGKLIFMLKPLASKHIRQIRVGIESSFEQVLNQ